MDDGWPGFALKPGTLRRCQIFGVCESSRPHLTWPAALALNHAGQAVDNVHKEADEEDEDDEVHTRAIHLSHRLLIRRPVSIHAQAVSLPLYNEASKQS